MTDTTQTLDSVLIDAIQKTQGAIGEATDFVLAQAPELIQQLLLWKATESFIEMAIGIAIAVWTVVFVKKMVLVYKEDSPHEWGILTTMTIMAACIPMGISLAIINLTWLKIWIAPKLFLLEYAASLIK